MLTYIAPAWSDHATKLLSNFFVAHLRNSTDLDMNDLCYEYSQDGVRLNSFDCVFVHREVRCTNKNEIKDGL